MADAFEQLGFVEEQPAAPARNDFSDLGFAPDDGEEQAAPRRRTLDERMQQREQMEGHASKLWQQELRALGDLKDKWRRSTGGTITHGNEDESALAWAARRSPDDAAAIQSLREERHAVSAEAEKLGVGQRGRIIGSTIGGVLGAVGGGALGSLAGPAGTVGGTIGGSAAGTGLGSYLGSKFDLASGEDITPAEAERLLEDRAVEDVAFDAAGSLIFFGGGKLLKVTGATPALKRLAQRYLGLGAEQAAKEATPAAGRYVKPGESIAALPFETLGGKQMSEQTASRVNQKLTNWRVAADLGISPDQLTAEGLSALRKREGAAYEAVKALPGRVQADDAYKQALAELRAGLESESFPDVEMGKAARNLVTAADRASMKPRDIVEFAKRLRASANKNALAFNDPEKTELARAQRSVAEELEDLLERHVADSNPELMQTFRQARQRIAKSYDAERALTSPGEIDARQLGTLAKKRPVSGGMAEAATFGQANPKYAQPPSKLGANHLSNVLTNIVFATAGGLGGGSHDTGLGVAGALAGFFARRGSREALEAIYRRAAARGDVVAKLHASRLVALSQGAMTGAKAQLVKESAEALLRAGYGGEL